MNHQMIEVMRRRSELLARISSQREQVAEIGMRWQPALGLADQGVSAVRFLRSHPVVVAGAIALLVVRRRGLIGLVKTSLGVWKGYRYIKAFAGELQPHS